jgi:hypothetical protein
MKEQVKIYPLLIGTEETIVCSLCDRLISGAEVWVVVDRIEEEIVDIFCVPCKEKEEKEDVENGNEET